MEITFTVNGELRSITIEENGPLAHEVAAVARKLVSGRLRRETVFSDLLMSEAMNRGIGGPPGSLTPEQEWERCIAWHASLTMCLTTIAAAGFSFDHPHDLPEVTQRNGDEFLESLAELGVTF